MEAAEALDAGRSPRSRCRSRRSGTRSQRRRRRTRRRTCRCTCPCRAKASKEAKEAGRTRRAGRSPRSRCRTGSPGTRRRGRRRRRSRPRRTWGIRRMYFGRGPEPRETVEPVDQKEHVEPPLVPEATRREGRSPCSRCRTGSPGTRRQGRRRRRSHPKRTWGFRRTGRCRAWGGKSVPRPSRRRSRAIVREPSTAETKGPPAWRRSHNGGPLSSSWSVRVQRVDLRA